MNPGEEILYNYGESHYPWEKKVKKKTIKIFVDNLVYLCSFRQAVICLQQTAIFNVQVTTTVGVRSWVRYAHVRNCIIYW